jgi:hypothetical protein
MSLLSSGAPGGAIELPGGIDPFFDRITAHVVESPDSVIAFSIAR